MLTRLVGKEHSGFRRQGREGWGALARLRRCCSPSNQIKQGMLHTLVGDWSMYANAHAGDNTLIRKSARSAALKWSRTVWFSSLMRSPSSTINGVRSGTMRGCRRGGYFRMFRERLPTLHWGWPTRDLRGRALYSWAPILPIGPLATSATSSANSWKDLPASTGLKSSRPLEGQPRGGSRQRYSS